MFGDSKGLTKCPWQAHSLECCVWWAWITIFFSFPLNKERNSTFLTFYQSPLQSTALLKSSSPSIAFTMTRFVDFAFMHGTYFGCDLKRKKNAAMADGRVLHQQYRRPISLAHQRQKQRWLNRRDRSRGGENFQRAEADQDFFSGRRMERWKPQYWASGPQEPDGDAVGGQEFSVGRWRRSDHGAKRCGGAGLLEGLGPLVGELFYFLFSLFYAKDY